MLLIVKNNWILSHNPTAIHWKQKLSHVWFILSTKKLEYHSTVRSILFLRWRFHVKSSSRNWHHYSVQLSIETHWTTIVSTQSSSTKDRYWNSRCFSRTTKRCDTIILCSSNTSCRSYNSRWYWFRWQSTTVERILNSSEIRHVRHRSYEFLECKFIHRLFQSSLIFVD